VVIARHRTTWFSCNFVVICLTILGVASGVLAGGEGSAVVRCDLASCLQIALTRHPDLQNADAKKLAAQSKIDFEKAEWTPHLDFKGESGYLSGKAVSPFSVIAGVTEEGVPQRDVSGGYYIGSLTLSVPIVREGRLLGQNSPSIQGARFGLAVEENLVLTRRSQISYNVTAAYISVVKATAVVDDQEQLVKLTEPQYQLALAKFQQSLVSRNELLLAEVQLATAQRELTRAKDVLAYAKRELTRAMGLDMSTSVEVLDTHPLPVDIPSLPPLEELLVFAHEHRSEVRAQEAQIQAKGEEVKRIRGERFPSLELIAGYNIGNDFNPPTNSQWNTRAQLTGPLFDFGRNEQKVAFARTIMTQEVTKLESLKGDIASQVQDVYFRIRNLLAELSLLEKQSEQATEALKLDQARFRQQLLPAAVVAEDEKALAKLTQARVLARYDLSLAYSQLELVTGGWTGEQR
jgi:heterocyst glycolipid deposition protein